MHIFNTTGSTERLLFFNGVVHLDAEVTAIMEIVSHHVRLVMQGGNDFSDLVAFEKVDDVLGDGAVEHGDHWFRQVAG